MFDALDDCLDPVLRMPVGGVEVEVPYPSIRKALRLKRWYADLAAGVPVDDIDPVVDLIGAVWDADAERYACLPEGVSTTEARICGWTALAYFGVGHDAAMRIYTNDTSDPEPEPEEPELLDDPWWGPYDPRPGALGPDDPGGGPVDPATGIRRWYNEEPAEARALSATWTDLLRRWNAVVADFQQYYHLELDALLDDRDIGWLEARIAGLQEIAGSRIQTITALAKES